MSIQYHPCIMWPIVATYIKYEVGIGLYFALFVFNEPNE